MLLRSLLTIICPLFLFSSIICPEPLEKGDLIALVFPASYLNNRETAADVIVNNASYLQKKGYRTILYPEVIHPIGDFSGEDSERANALMDAWKNPEVKAIWCVRGGWGSSKMMGLLDFEWIKSHPKIFIGMSDITALHQALGIKAGLVTYLAPVLNFFTSDDFDSEFAFQEFEKVALKQEFLELPLILKEFAVIKNGIAKGRLIGGNLCLIASLCGTPWQLNTDGKILILEDVGEATYKIDRMLWQLKESGLLDNPAAVILGTWEECEKEEENSFSLDEIFDRYFKDASYPVLKGLATGHGNIQGTIPLNMEAKINTYASVTISKAGTQN